MGTGNLLARNLDIPLSEDESLKAAFGGQTRDIDLIKVAVDGAPSEHFAVIGGLGVDAMIMEETNPQLKDVIGAGAYFVAAAKALGRTPIEMRIAVDDHRVPSSPRHDLCDWQCRHACRQSHLCSRTPVLTTAGSTCMSRHRIASHTGYGSFFD